MTNPPTAAMSDGAVRKPATSSDNPSAAAAATTPAMAAGTAAGRIGSMAGRVSAAPETVASVIRASSSSSMTFALLRGVWGSPPALVDVVGGIFRPTPEPGGEPACPNRGFDRQPQCSAESGSGQAVPDRTSCNGPTGAEDERLLKAARDLLEVMSDEPDRAWSGLVGEPGEIADERLASAEVETRTGLVEDQEVRVRHERPGNLDAPPFAGGQQTERSIGKPARPDLVEQ